MSVQAPARYQPLAGDRKPPQRIPGQPQQRGGEYPIPPLCLQSHHNNPSAGMLSGRTKRCGQASYNRREKKKPSESISWGGVV